MTLKKIRYGGATLALVAALVATSVARAADDVSLFLDWVPGGFAAAWYDGIDQKCFADRGINLTVKRGYGGVDTVTKIAAKVGEFGIADLGSIMIGRIRSNATVRAIMPIYAASPLAIAVLASGPVKTLKDLEGRKVGAAPGDSSIILLPIAMKQAGADFTKIQKVTADSGALTGLLLQGNVDADTTYVTSGITIVDAGKSVGKDVQLINFGQHLGIYSNALFTSDDLLEKNPGLAKRFKEGAVCAFDGAHANLDRAVAALVAQVGGLDVASQRPIAVVALSLAYDSPAYKKAGFGWDTDQVARTLAILTEAQGVSTDLAPAASVVEP